MAAPKLFEAHQTQPEHLPATVNRPIFRRVMACVETTPFAHTVLVHAAAVAQAMGARLTVMHVLEPSIAGQSPADPVEWNLRRHEALARIARLVAYAGEDQQIESYVVDGLVAESICQLVREQNIDLTVLGTYGGSDHFEWELSSTARRVAESISSSVMLVPPAETGGDAVRYRRIVLPLDGSSRAESALPIASRIAKSQEAEVLLIHAVPDVGLTEFGPFEAEDIDLRDQLHRRNERVAQRYLKRIHASMSLAGVSTRIRLLPVDDPRHALVRAISEEEVDLIVLCSQGISGHRDMPIGSTAEFLIAHTMKPVLMVRRKNKSPAADRRRGAMEALLRLPGGTLA